MTRRRTPVVISFAFALLGVLMLIFGDADTRVLGAMSVLFFGVGGSVFALPLLSRRGAGTVRIADGGFLIPMSRAKQLLALVACLGMTAASVLIALASPWVGVPCAVVFGVFALILLVRLPAPTGLLLTPTRLISAYGNRAELDWDDVARVFLYEQSRARILGIAATAPERVQRRRNGPLARFNRSLTRADIVLPADYFTLPPERVVELVALYAEAPARRAAIGTPAELLRLAP